MKPYTIFSQINHTQFFPKTIWKKFRCALYMRNIDPQRARDLLVGDSASVNCHGSPNDSHCSHTTRLLDRWKCTPSTHFPGLVNMAPCTWSGWYMGSQLNVACSTSHGDFRSWVLTYTPRFSFWEYSKNSVCYDRGSAIYEEIWYNNIRGDLCYMNFLTWFSV